MRWFYIGIKTGKYIECEYCGKTVYKTLSQYNKREHHFCSNKCQSLKRRELTFEYRTCEICGKDFYVSKKSTQRFCSIECQKIWQRGNTGFNNKKFQGGHVDCEHCGNKFLVGKTIYESDRHHFCSVECRKSWYSAIWSQSEQWKEASRIRAVQILSKGSASTQTKPQVAVNEMLDSLGVHYRNEEPFDFYSIDNYLVDYDLVIEVMGDYWHSSPLKYSLPLNAKQSHIVSRDKAKHTYIKNNYGIEVLYLWETDIFKSPEVCKAMIAEYIKNGGAMCNYHSFNYHMEDGVLALNNELITPHQGEYHKIAC